MRMTGRGPSNLVLGLAMLVQGCAGSIPGKEPAAIPTVTSSGPGRFEVQAGRPGLVIAAPHGTSDTATDVIGRDLGRMTGWGVVVATGFSHVDNDGRRLNVNRPTESVPGSAPGLEGETDRARAVYGAYRGHVSEAARGALVLYVEVHGNVHKDSAGRVEIATVGISREDAWRLKTLLEVIRDAHTGGADGVPRLEIWMDGLDPVRYSASAAKRVGMLSTATRALHIELPRVARTTYRQTYTGILAEFLAQSAPLLVPREP